MLSLPVLVTVAGVHVDSFVSAPVDAQVSLSLPIQVQRAQHDPASAGSWFGRGWEAS
jgi:hypothetical protein